MKSIYKVTSDIAPKGIFFFSECAAKETFNATPGAIISELQLEDVDDPAMLAVMCLNGTIQSREKVLKMKLEPA